VLQGYANTLAGMPRSVKDPRKGSGEILTGNQPVGRGKKATGSLQGVISTEGASIGDGKPSEALRPGHGEFRGKEKRIINLFPGEGDLVGEQGRSSWQRDRELPRLSNRAEIGGGSAAELDCAERPFGLGKEERGKTCPEGSL